jgi:D-3-phosphoglycerate dehydrogenase / 2-oxoglutarate reductase
MPTDNRPLVVLAGPIHPDGHALLAGEADVTVAEDLTEAAMVSLARDAQGVLFRSKPLCSATLMAACPRLRVVGRHGAGLDIVDIPAATRLGVAVVHAPGANAQAVAEHALMLMLMCAKRAVQVDRWTRDGDWRARHDPRNEELAGKTLGIVGVGNIGRRVARFAGALGMRVLAYDKYLPADEVRRRGAEPTVSLEALLPQVDVLTCHTPLTDETRAMINPKTLGLLKPFWSTPRGVRYMTSAPSSRPSPPGISPRPGLTSSRKSPALWIILFSGCPTWWSPLTWPVSQRELRARPPCRWPARSCASCAANVRRSW